MGRILDSLGDRPRVAVIGASGGIGAALVRAVAADGRAELHALSRSGEVPEGENIRPGRIDIEDEDSIAEAAEAAGELDAVLVATGLLHDGDGMQPEKAWSQIAPGPLERAFRVNAAGPALVAKHFLGRVPRRERAIFGVLSARVGSISDNRAGGWYAYRASKAALNQILRCLANEAARKRPKLVIAGLQPGTVATPLSEPFDSARGEDVFAPEEAARNLLGVLDGLTPERSGRLFAWDGTEFDP